MSKEEQLSKLLENMVKFLSINDITADQAKMKKHFVGVDIGSGDKTAIVNAVSRYLSSDEDVPEAKLQDVLTQGQSLLTTVLPSLGIEPELTNGEKAAFEEAKEATVDGGSMPKQSNGTTVVRIEDGHAWKASMTVAPGARPVTDLSDFEENEAKL